MLHPRTPVNTYRVWHTWADDSSTLSQKFSKLWNFVFIFGITTRNATWIDQPVCWRALKCLLHTEDRVDSIIFPLRGSVHPYSCYRSSGDRRGWTWECRCNERRIFSPKADLRVRQVRLVRLSYVKCPGWSGGKIRQNNMLHPRVYSS